MAEDVLGTDASLLDLLRRSDSLTVTELSEQIGVTATAVRQRLGRLLARGMIERRATREGRGRPSHHYQLTSKGRRQTGSNFADLALALWNEVRDLKDPEVRRGLLQRLAKRLSNEYAGEMEHIEGTANRMDAVAELFIKKQVPFEVDRTNPLLPVLNALACPYPELAEQDRSICSLERMMFAELLGEDVRLSGCRLDGGNCCSFTPRSSEVTS